MDLYLALKRRKLFVISGKLNPGRLIYLVDLLSPVSNVSAISSTGMTCCKSLRKCSAPSPNKPIAWTVGVSTYFAKRRSCSELLPDSLLLSSLLDAASCSLCFSFDPDKVSLIFFRLLSLSDDVVSRPGSWMTGIGSSRFAKASAVEFSIMS